MHFHVFACSKNVYYTCVWTVRVFGQNGHLMPLSICVDLCDKYPIVIDKLTSSSDIVYNSCMWTISG